MLASTRNDNEDCIRQGRPVYPPIIKVFLSRIQFSRRRIYRVRPLTDTIFIIIVRWQHCLKRFKLHTFSVCATSHSIFADFIILPEYYIYALNAKIHQTIFETQPMQKIGIFHDQKINKDS